MREGIPSLTAMFVAFARAIATHDSELSAACQDPCAERLLPETLGRPVASLRKSALALRTVRAASLGLFDHLALRTALIDEALHAAVDRGISQVVILGAGLDARAHRLRWLERCTVFEVDHPSTQGLKRRKAATMPVRACELRYAPCDFQDVSLDEALLGQGLDPERPSVFIWEGVTMYLPASAVDQSLARISRLSASGSTLVATYLTPQVTAYGRVFTQAGLATLSLAFEPVRSTYTEAEMRARLLQQGFRAQHDVLPLTQAASRGIGGAAPLWGVPDEHVVVALKA